MTTTNTTTTTTRATTTADVSTILTTARVAELECVYSAFLADAMDGRAACGIVSVACAIGALAQRGALPTLARMIRQDYARPADGGLGAHVAPATRRTMRTLADWMDAEHERHHGAGVDTNGAPICVSRRQTRGAARWIEVYSDATIRQENGGAIRSSVADAERGAARVARLAAQIDGITYHNAPATCGACGAPRVKAQHGAATCARRSCSVFGK